MASKSDYWEHDLSPFLIEFPQNPLGLEGIRYYGLAYLLGFIAAWYLLKVYDQRGQFTSNADQRATLMTAVILGVLVGGRLGFMLLYDWHTFIANPLTLFRVDQGGMASHGGFFGVICAIFWYAWRHQCGLFALGDALATVTPIGLMLGRIANFINGELWGRVSDFKYAVIFPDSPEVYNPVTGDIGPEPRHASQLYQAALEGALLLAFVQWRYWKTKPPAGQLSGEFLIGYGVVRIIGEQFREPDAALILNLSRGQFYSIFIILGGAVLITLARKKASNA